MGIVSCYLVLACCASLEGKVELEIVIEKGVFGTQHEWLQRLGRVGVDDLKMRSARQGDRVAISKTESGGSIIYKVTGVLTADNRILMPGGTYRASQMANLTAWIRKLKAEGFDDPDPANRKMAFGLTADELVALHQSMSSKVARETKGVPIKDVVRQIQDSLTISISIHESAVEVLQGNEKVKEELKGLTCGTALANCIRPLGLVVAPVKQRGRVVLSLVDSRRVEEHWPIGWPTQKAPREVAPKLFEFLEVEINDFALDATLDAIEAKLSIPFLYDQNLLAKHDIDLEKVKVSIPDGRSYYYLILRRITAQVKPQMKPELRIDEAGQPFIWLSTYRK